VVENEPAVERVRPKKELRNAAPRNPFLPRQPPGYRNRECGKERQHDQNVGKRDMIHLRDDNATRHCTSSNVLVERAAVGRAFGAVYRSRSAPTGC